MVNHITLCLYQSLGSVCLRSASLEEGIRLLGHPGIPKVLPDIQLQVEDSSNELAGEKPGKEKSTLSSSGTYHCCYSLFRLVQLANRQCNLQCNHVTHLPLKSRPFPRCTPLVPFFALQICLGVWTQICT